MHSPGVCGAILALHQQFGAKSELPQSNAPDIGPLIDALNDDTEMVLVAAAEMADALAPAIWARAAYLVQLSPGAAEADGLRALLQETLSRGRDAILVTTLQGPALQPSAPTKGAPGTLTAEIVGRMVAAYRAAGHEIWAIVSEDLPQEAGPASAYPMLLGRGMIELFLRGREWRSAQEVLSANREHVRALNLSVADSGSPASP